MSQEITPELLTEVVHSAVISAVTKVETENQAKAKEDQAKGPEKKNLALKIIFGVLFSAANGFLLHLPDDIANEVRDKLIPEQIDQAVEWLHKLGMF